ncbi:antitoxin [Phenylobacterium sp.]|uniref:antitoxin n=1 Tax=Phenylobacterium sp. TaxID=1871053 RepID=UPI0035B14F8D
MRKPQSITGYKADVAHDAERVLVTLLRKLGPWRKSIFLVGGLAPRYIVEKRPPSVPPHAGTGDVDVVVDVAILADTEAYSTLEENLKAMGFERATNDKGVVVNWRWSAKLEHGGTIILEFLAHDPNLKGGALQELPTKGNVSAINIPFASMVFDLHDTREVEAELLDGGGVAIETIAYANLVSFTCLKAFAYDHRHEGKDAHDLVYCLEHAEGGLEPAAAMFREALAGKHADAIAHALEILRQRFAAREHESYRLDGPVAVARFEIDGDEDDSRNRRIVRQRTVADVIARLLAALG